MIRTIPYRRLTSPPSPPQRRSRRRKLAAETGDTLIEVLISAVLVVLVVVATLTGLNNTNRATSIDRARSQADALAQQDEDQLRSEPIAKLSELNRSHTATENGTEYTITSTSEYISDATSTSSCSSTNPSANYLQTTSKVTWRSLGAAKPVVESGIISPSPGSTLIVQATEAGAPVQGASVAVTGSPSSTLETSSNGCAIFAVLPGSFEINVSKAGYVDQNGYPNSNEDASVTHSVYLTAENASKQAYALGQAGKLQVNFTNGASATEGDTFVAYNSAMTAFRQFGTVASYNATVSSPTTMFPFPATSPYTVYAGTCEADLPSALLPSNTNPTVQVPAGATGIVTVTAPPVNIKVMSGTGPGASTEGTVVTAAKGYTVDTGCSTKRSIASTPAGALPHPSLPFGHYSMCLESGGRKWEHAFVNETSSGPLSSWTGDGTSGSSAVIYMGTNPSGSPSNTSAAPCP
jgi:Tfp pilus assembly protein PilV